MSGFSKWWHQCLVEGLRDVEQQLGSGPMEALWLTAKHERNREGMEICRLIEISDTEKCKGWAEWECVTLKADGVAW